MPKVVMLVSMAADNWSLIPGDVTEVSEEIAVAWQEHGIAKPYIQEEVKVIDYNAEMPLPSEEFTDTIDPTEPTKPTELLGDIEPILGNEEEEIKHVGGGWYLLPNGEKVQGKDEAQEALKELQGSED